MRKIAIDLRSLETPTGKRGVGYFNRNIFSRLVKIPHPNLQLNLFTFPKSSLQKNKIDSGDIFFSVPALFWPKRGLRRLDPFFALFWNNALKKIHPDLLHIPFLFDTYFLSVPDNIPTVITLYDIIPLLFPNQYFQNQKAKDWYIERLNQAKKAAKIITISKSSKRDIERYLKIPTEKITVIYGGVDEIFKPGNKQNALKLLSNKYKIRHPFILSVSTHSFHKNVSRIFQVFREVAYDRNLTLVIICKLIPQEEKDWRQEIKNLGLEKKVILTNFVEDGDLPLFYQGAELLLFPSLYEGLGLPVLEAFACGCPVVTSNTSSLPEVGGEAAFYVEPQSTADIKRSITKILGDKILRESLIKEGFSQIKKFSWERGAKQTLKVYNEVLNSH